jgi:hypothetical protein
MSKSIPLSPKHGVNPTIPICFFCRENKNEIALLGRLPKDQKAPTHTLIDYEPCDKCKEKFKEGVLIIECTQHPNIPNQPPIQQHAYPTGDYVVVKPHILNEPFNKPNTKTLMHTNEFQKCFKNTEDKK